ncbi:MAG: PBP1A family penicillin-binding protein [Desulfobacterales bacterium]|jgi:penicillin-binding protein 1A|nr:PBP1A family penicillin-binding protein [Desulfobacteraceae bacterium]MBT4364858.1 PBP1A family penicillin-binding protein [Desulfobacteraceae bacterium]MBT7696610.1 PBP1A family penicillin-binding protein [Desulfobacterales bacterium]
MAKKKPSSIRKARAKEREKGWMLKKIFSWFFIASILSIMAAACALIGFYFYISEGLPKISSLKDYHPPLITSVYSDDNRKIGEFYNERRVIIHLDEIPDMLVEAFIAAEDARYYIHKGIDFFSVVRALFKNVEAGTIVQGGSTITQQVTKRFLLTPERSYSRKIKEAILAYRIDKTLSKDEILYLYLNEIYLGHGAYGVEAAAENYFGKSTKNISLAECAMLAGLPQAPSKYSPFRYPERAKNRQIYVLNRMLAEGYITETQRNEAINENLDIKPRRNWYKEKVPWYTEHVRRYIEKKYGPDLLYNGGLKIYTAVNIEMQKAARSEVETGLRNLDKRQGYRGPLNHLEPEEIEPFSKEIIADMKKSPLLEGKVLKGVVIDVNDTEKFVIVRIGNILGRLKLENMRWARKPDIEVQYNEYGARIKHPGDVLSTGDVILVKAKDIVDGDTDTLELDLEQTPLAQAAVLCIEAGTGHVKTMIGGRDFSKTKFNRATQSRRQPGSAFKPIIFSAAIDKGYTPATVMIDSPYIAYEENGFTWKPRNYDGEFHGEVLIRRALAKSLNVVAVKILKDIGLDYAIQYSAKLGIKSSLSRDLTIGLGSSGVSLLELTASYSIFTNLGKFVRPVFITKILDRDGNVLEENNLSKEEVIDKRTAYIMTSLLESVVREGTGRRVRKLNRPTAGKTGTTNNLNDAWFVGYTPSYITGTWVGFDDKSSLGKGETGSRAASPIWLGFMQKILKDKPEKNFQVPEGIVFIKIDSETGLLPIPESRKTRFECFKEETVPTEYTKKPNSISDPEQFYKSDM